MAEAVVELSQVTRRFGEESPLAGIDLIVRRGESVSLMGPSGSGKTTLLNLLALLDRCTAGSYRLNGVEVATLADRGRSRARASDIGMVFQRFHLLSRLNVVENVMLGGLYSEVSDRFERAAALLDAVGLQHRLSALPATLSGGEQQRVAIARALMNRPLLFLADEPTGNLDPAATSQVLDLIDQVRDAGAAVVLVTHDEVVAARATASFRLQAGRLSRCS